MSAIDQKWLRWAIALISAYVLGLGGTFGGMLHPLSRFLTLSLLLVLFGLWLVGRQVRAYPWYQTPLDPLPIVWGGVLVLSLAVNVESGRRILMGIWYASLYMTLWYLLHDALAQSIIRRESLVDGLLISGGGMLLLGLAQVLWALLQDGTLSPIMGTFGNQNFMGAYLAMLLFLAIGRWGTLQKGRWRLELYGMVTALLLVFTGSRGALMGSIAGLVVLGVLGLHSQGLLSREALLRGWQGLSAKWQRLVWLGMGGLVVGGASLIAALLYSLTLPGRGAGLRTYLWDAALSVFGESPLLGKGLFTFGQHLPRFTSIPGSSPHSHAHNLILHMAAELGLVGVMLLLVSVVVAAWLIHRQWHMSHGAARWLLAGAIGALVSVAVHQQVDVPVMMPAIAVMALLMLILGTAPAVPVLLTSPFRLRGHPVVMVGLCVSLLLTGFWSAMVYQQYWGVIHEALDTGQYYEAAQQLQPVIEAEPNLSLYQGQQAYLLGLAAAETEDEAVIAEAIVAYEAVVELEPYYAPYQANLAALYHQIGETQQGMLALLRAIWLAPSVRVLWEQLPLFALAAIDADLVENAPALTLDDLNSDFQRAESIAHGQFLRDAIGRQFLPQVAFSAEG